MSVGSGRPTDLAVGLTEAPMIGTAKRVYHLA
jgi:hypothetical protein